MALEHGLARGVLVALAGENADTRGLDAWLKQAVASGLLVGVGPTRALALTAAPSREPGYSVHPELWQLVLRELSRRGALEPIALATHGLLGGRSVSDLSLALQLGDYRAFTRRFSVERLPRQIKLRSAAEWLRVSICEPFDAVWLERTWGEEATPVATRVLRECLEAGTASHGLLGYLRARFEAMAEGDARQELAALLCEDALLRGQLEAVAAYLPFLPRASALGHAAAWAFASGDVALAQLRLDELFGSSLHGSEGAARRSPLPQCGAVSPVLALLLCARDTEASVSLAKRLMSAVTSEPARAAGRSFRLLLRYLEEPETEHERIDVHDLSNDAGVWETLLSAHNAALHQKQPETRARWAQHLVRRALELHAAAYAWLARQTWLLAQELSEEYARTELERLGGSALAALEGNASLWDVVAPKPEWQKTLQALAAVSDSVEEAAEASLRAAWYVDMADGSLSRPGLQERRIDSGGWSQGRRLSLVELYQHREQLPPEDQRVLEATREPSEGRRELTPDAYERLVGHPRVFNGARSNARVEVVLENCRVQALEESGYIRVMVEPEGARLGVNVVPQGEDRLLVYRVTEAMQRVIDVVPRGLRVPVAQKGEVLRVLGKLSQSVEVQSPELGAERQVEADATPCLRFAVHAGAWMVQAGVRPFGSQGRFFVAGVGRTSLSYVGPEGRLRCERDFERERASVDALIAACKTLREAPEEQEGRPEHETDNWVLGEEAVLLLLSELREVNVPHALEWPERNRLRLRGDSRASLHGRLRVEKGWYLATGGMRIDDVSEVTLRELLHAPALAGGRFVRLENGDYVELEARVRRVMAALSAAGSRERPQGELRLHAGALSALRELAGEGFDLDPDASDWLARVERVQRETFEVPASLSAELRPYQLDGFLWLSRLSALGMGACLADDMGLGKTVQILALLLARREEGAALVVAPTSVCSNWAREARRFAPELEVLEYTGDARADLLDGLKEAAAGKLVICSYALLQQDQAKLTAQPWGTAVLDEAQFIKNAQSLRAQAAFRLEAKQRIAATGTPVENHAADLWSIFHFINPGLLGEAADFNRRFGKPIDREGGQSPEEQLSRVIQPYVLRRLKRDVLRELPPITELSHEVTLSADETARYAILRKQVHDKLFTSHGKRENKIEVLAEITRLRRFCCHPRLVFPEAELESSKIQAFMELVLELRENGHRALVFSQFVDFLALVREQLEERQVSYEYLDGSTPQAERQKRVDAFQNGSASLFLISLKAGGFGLNLTAADYVIHLDPWWNPAVESQATDRAHRIGQERRVTVYRLVTRNTIEEKIVELHEKKRALARSLLDGGAKAATLSVAELVKLIEDTPRE
jgi:superfamily II DNA or RNA helicase